MPGYVFLTQGDLTRIRCDYIAYTTDCGGDEGQLASAFNLIRPGFASLVKGWVGECGSSLGIGSTKRLAVLPGGRTVIGVVSTRETKTESTAGAEAAVRASIQCVPTEEHRRLIALPAVNFGEGGNREARLKSARAQLQAAGDELEYRSDLDVIFVTYDSSSYRIFQQARASLSINKVELGIPHPPAALIDRLRRGQCVTFVGAGVSAESGLPNWSELLDHLELQAGFHPSDPPQVADLKMRAQALRASHPKDVDLWVSSKFSGAFDEASELVPSAVHYTLASLPVRFYFTTNYDGLIETTLRNARRYPMRIVSQPEVAETGDSGGTYVIKLHGDADHPDDGIVLSQSD